MASEKTLSTDAPNAVIADQGLVYCRTPVGEVVACDASDMELMKKIRRGWQVLADYGQFGSSAYYMDHPYEALFQAGGAREMSARQVYFPQLAGLSLPEAPPMCEYCGRDDLPTERALRQHQDVMHNDRKQQQDLGAAIVGGLQQTGMTAGGLDVQTIAAVVASTLASLGYGQRGVPDPTPIPPPDDDEEDEDQPEIPSPEPHPEPEPEPEPAAGSHRRR